MKPDEFIKLAEKYSKILKTVKDLRSGEACMEIITPEQYHDDVDDILEGYTAKTANILATYWMDLHRRLQAQLDKDMAKMTVEQVAEKMGFATSGYVETKDG